jgi:hypothetical protein
VLWNTINLQVDQQIPRYRTVPHSVSTLQSVTMKFISSLLLLLTPVALALPTSVVTDVEAPVEAEIEARQCYVQCGSTCYTSSQVSAARSAGYNYYRQGNQAGSSTYPHQYNNYEGFDFLVSGPYQEFPLRTSGAYTGGKKRNKTFLRA